MAQPQSAGAGHAAGPGDRTIVRGTVGPEGARLSYLAAEGGAGGETILLIHGAGVSARSWIHQLEGLSGTLRVLALDLPGRGESAPIREPSVEGYAESAHRLLAALGTGPVWVAGHSLGGAVAQALAARHPERVKGLVLISSCARLPRSESPLQRLSWLLLPNPARKFLFFLTVKKFLFAPDASRQAFVLGMEEIRSCPEETRGGDVAAARAMDLEEPARRLRLPALIVCGSLDRLTPPALSAQLQALIPGARLDIIEGAGHMLPLERPDELNARIRAFVRPAEPATPPRLVPAGWRVFGSVLRALLSRTRAALGRRDSG